MVRFGVGRKVIDSWRGHRAVRLPLVLVAVSVGMLGAAGAASAESNIVDADRLLREQEQR